MGVQGTTSISVGQLILRWGGQEWEAPGEQEGRCWVGEDFMEELTLESLEIRCKFGQLDKGGEVISNGGKLCKALK